MRIKSKIKPFFIFMLVLLTVSAFFAEIYNIVLPKSISVFSGTDADNNISMPFVTLQYNKNSDQQKALVNSDIITSKKADAVLFGILPVKSVDVSVYENIRLYPGGMPFGIKFHTAGVLIVGISEVDGEKGNINPGYNCGLRTKDIITKINGNEINTVEELVKYSEDSEGQNLKVTIQRDNEEMNFEITPVYSKSEQKYKLGLWVRDGTAGIGTVTFINKGNNTFAGLGHGICDVDTGVLMPLREGTIVNVIINGINKGEVGFPGELKGYFNSGKIGTLIGNTNYGVYGVLANIPDITAREALPIALKNQVHEGDAYIYCTTEGNTISKYDIKILKINNDTNNTKNFIIKITDEALIEKTGGIVQGMSGSPIIQDGKIAGAVTHVLIDDPTRGYGIFVENMLSNMPGLFYCCKFR